MLHLLQKAVHQHLETDRIWKSCNTEWQKVELCHAFSQTEVSIGW